MTSEQTDPDALQALKGPITAVLNTASGSWTRRAPAEVSAILEGAGLGHGRVVCVAPKQLDDALDEAVAEAGVLVVLGGDGTIRAAAEKCGQTSTHLIPLPGGTMNMLPKALYGARDWKSALTETLANPLIHAVSGGRASGHGFFVAALLGAPTLWADAREAVRSGHFIEAGKRASTAMRRGMSEPLAYEFGADLSGPAEAVAVMCPLISKVMSEDEKRLEAAAIDTRTAGDVLRLGFNTLMDDWRSDPAVVRAQVRRVVVTGRTRVPVILDGERVRLGKRVEIDFVSVAFRAIVPAGI